MLSLNAQPNCTKRCLFDLDFDFKFHVYDCGVSICTIQNSFFIPVNRDCTLDYVYSGNYECEKANEDEFERFRLEPSKF